MAVGGDGVFEGLAFVVGGFAVGVGGVAAHEGL